MRKIIGFLTLVGVVVSLTGCIESKQDFVLNPNGSGKVAVEYFSQGMDINMGGEAPDPTEQLKDSIKATLEDSSGVDAWKEVAYERLDDNRIHFKGTAYFKDISKLKLKLGGVSVMKKPVFTKHVKGGMVLVLESEKEDEGDDQYKDPFEGLSDEEITKKIKMEKGKYQQMRPMLVSFLTNMKMDMSFSLPGDLQQVNNFKKDNKSAVRISFEGAKMLEIMDEMVADDSWMREMMRSGGDFAEKGPWEDAEMNKRLYGEVGPIQAVVAGELKPLFDYTAEATAAKEGYAQILKKLGSVEDIPVVALASGEGFKSLKVGGVRLITISDQKRGVRPFNYDAGYTLSLIGELPGAVLKVKGGELKKAIADNGQDLLPQREWGRKIQSPNLSKDKATVVFEVRLSLPGEEVKSIKEISGTLQYIVAGGSKKIDLGTLDFIAGGAAKEFGAFVVSVKESEWLKSKQKLTLKLEIPRDKIKKVTFYSNDGSVLEVSEVGSTWASKDTTLYFSIEGQFPAQGRIVVEVYEGLNKYTIPFKMTDISLEGRLIK